MKPSAKFERIRILERNRVDVIKQQTDKVKLQYKQEYEEYLKQEQEYNTTHQKIISLEEYFRNAEGYIKEKEAKGKPPENFSQFRSVSPAENKGETMNITQRIRDEKRPTKTDERKLNIVKSLDRLPK